MGGLFSCKLDVKKFLIINFPEYFLILMKIYQHTTIVPYALFTNNLLISFVDHLSNLNIEHSW